MILGTNGVAAAAAGGVLLTVTGMAESLCFAAWVVADRLWRAPALGLLRAGVPEPRLCRLRRLFQLSQPFRGRRLRGVDTRLI
ncbi:MAG TPA: hypothetical protein VES79_10305 [Solirubrobacteraceae bacterium]|nr:hypothetical protein [Solirubrobacteraceae bacterium]